MVRLAGQGLFFYTNYCRRHNFYNEKDHNTIYIHYVTSQKNSWQVLRQGSCQVRIS